MIYDFICGKCKERKEIDVPVKASFEQAYSIMTSKDLNVLGGTIEYRNPKDLVIANEQENKYPEVK